VVDRPEPGARGDDDRQPERDGEVADVVGGVDRDPQPADALDDERVGARRGGARGAGERGKRQVAALELGGEVGRDRGRERLGADVARARRSPRRAARGPRATARAARRAP
jgi:hypothetical protein